MSSYIGETMKIKMLTHCKTRKKSSALPDPNPNLNPYPNPNLSLNHLANKLLWTTTILNSLRRVSVYSPTTPCKVRRDKGNGGRLVWGVGIVGQFDIFCIVSAYFQAPRPWCHLLQVRILKRHAEYPEKFEDNQLISKHSLILQIQYKDLGVTSQSFACCTCS